MSDVQAMAAAAANQPSPKPFQLCARAYELICTRQKPGLMRQRMLKLAAFLGRHWSFPDKLHKSFAVAREDMARIEELGMPAHIIRAVRDRLVEIGYLDQQANDGPKYQATRKSRSGIGCVPNLYQFGTEFVEFFQTAWRKRWRRQKAAPKAVAAGVARIHHVSGSGSYTGYVTELPGKKVATDEGKEPHSGVEAALGRLGVAAGYLSG